MVQYDNAQRAAALTLKVYGASNEEIDRQTGVVYSLAKIIRLLWPGNSPDLNMIEPY